MRRQGDLVTERPYEIASHHFVNFTGQADREGDWENLGISNLRIVNCGFWIFDFERFANLTK